MVIQLNEKKRFFQFSFQAAAAAAAAIAAPTLLLAGSTVISRIPKYSWNTTSNFHITWQLPESYSIPSHVQCEENGLQFGKYSKRCILLFVSRRFFSIEFAKNACFQFVVDKMRVRSPMPPLPPPTPPSSKPTCIHY